MSCSFPSNCNVGKALSTSHGRSSAKSPQLSDFCFLRLSNSALYNSCLLEGSKCSLRACLIDEYASLVVLPVNRVRAMCAFLVSRTWIQSVLSSSFHLFRAAILSKWLIRSSKFPVPSNFSGNTSGRVIVWCPTSTAWGIAVLWRCHHDPLLCLQKIQEHQFTCVGSTLAGTVGCHSTTAS